jgi:DNA ligase-1
MLLPTLDTVDQKRAVMGWWEELGGTELFLFNKLVTGEMRVGVSHRLVVRATAKASGVDEAVIAHRLTGNWRPTAAWFRALIAAEGGEVSGIASPYPFFLASPLEGPVEELGERTEWLVEWKWDGIRAQLIRRSAEVSMWSRGDELVTDRFPEIRDAAARLPDGVVIDGEIMAYRDGPLHFSLLQRRIGRQTLTPRVLAQAPAAMVAYDLLEEEGRDVRALPLRERRERLKRIVARGQARIVLSEELGSTTWADVAEARLLARERHVEGVMIKRLTSTYQVGRRRGDWWKWKVEPYAVDAVLVYAQPGHGRRANLLTDYTFAVWGRPPAEGIFADVAEQADREPELVPFAKAYSGLTDDEIAALDRWIRRHTIERFGPVRAVEPTQVFELHFEGISASTRHKAGIAVRFPRIARWRTDKPPEEADSLEHLKGLLRAPR